MKIAMGCLSLLVHPPSIPILLNALPTTTTTTETFQPSFPHQFDRPIFDQEIPIPSSSSSLEHHLKNIKAFLDLLKSSFKIRCAFNSFCASICDDHTGDRNLSLSITKTKLRFISSIKSIKSKLKIGTVQLFSHHGTELKSIVSHPKRTFLSTALSYTPAPSPSFEFQSLFNFSLNIPSSIQETYFQFLPLKIDQVFSATMISSFRFRFILPPIDGFTIYDFLLDPLHFIPSPNSFSLTTFLQLSALEIRVSNSVSPPEIQIPLIVLDGEVSDETVIIAKVESPSLHSSIGLIKFLNLNVDNNNLIGTRDYQNSQQLLHDDLLSSIGFFSGNEISFYIPKSIKFSFSMPILTLSHEFESGVIVSLEMRDFTFMSLLLNKCALKSSLIISYFNIWVEEEEDYDNYDNYDHSSGRKETSILSLEPYKLEDNKFEIGLDDKEGLEMKEREDGKEEEKNIDMMSKNNNVVVNFRSSKEEEDQNESEEGDEMINFGSDSEMYVIQISSESLVNFEEEIEICSVGDNIVNINFSPILLQTNPILQLFSEMNRDSVISKKMGGSSEKGDKDSFSRNEQIAIEQSFWWEEDQFVPISIPIPEPTINLYHDYEFPFSLSNLTTTTKLSRIPPIFQIPSQITLTIKGLQIDVSGSFISIDENLLKFSSSISPSRFPEGEDEMKIEMNHDMVIRQMTSGEFGRISQRPFRIESTIKWCGDDETGVQLMVDVSTIDMKIPSELLQQQTMKNSGKKSNPSSSTTPPYIAMSEVELLLNVLFHHVSSFLPSSPPLNLSFNIHLPLLNVEMVEMENEFGDSCCLGSFELSNSLLDFRLLKNSPTPLQVSFNGSFQMLTSSFLSIYSTSFESSFVYKPLSSEVSFSILFTTPMFISDRSSLSKYNHQENKEDEDQKAAIIDDEMKVEVYNDTSILLEDRKKKDEVNIQIDFSTILSIVDFIEIKSQFDPSLVQNYHSLRRSHNNHKKQQFNVKIKRSWFPLIINVHFYSCIESWELNLSIDHELTKKNDQQHYFSSHSSNLSSLDHICYQYLDYDQIITIQKCHLFGSSILHFVYKCSLISNSINKKEEGDLEIKANFCTPLTIKNVLPIPLLIEIGHEKEDEEKEESSSTTKVCTPLPPFETTPIFISSMTNLSSFFLSCCSDNPIHKKSVVGVTSWTSQIRKFPLFLPEMTQSPIDVLIRVSCNLDGLTFTISPKYIIQNISSHSLKLVESEQILSSPLFSSKGSSPLVSRNHNNNHHQNKMRMNGENEDKKMDTESGSGGRRSFEVFSKSFVSPTRDDVRYIYGREMYTEAQVFNDKLSSSSSSSSLNDGINLISIPFKQPNHHIGQMTSEVLSSSLYSTYIKDEFGTVTITLLDRLTLKNTTNFKFELREIDCRNMFKKRIWTSNNKSNQNLMEGTTNKGNNIQRLPEQSITILDLQTTNSSLFSIKIDDSGWEWSDSFKIQSQQQQSVIYRSLFNISKNEMITVRLEKFVDPSPHLILTTVSPNYLSHRIENRTYMMMRMVQTPLYLANMNRMDHHFERYIEVPPYHQSPFNHDPEQGEVSLYLGQENDTWKLLSKVNPSINSIPTIIPFQQDALMVEVCSGDQRLEGGQKKNTRIIVSMCNNRYEYYNFLYNPMSESGRNTILQINFEIKFESSLFSYNEKMRLSSECKAPSITLGLSSDEIHCIVEFDSLALSDIQSTTPFLQLSTNDSTKFTSNMLIIPSKSCFSTLSLATIDVILPPKCVFSIDWFSLPFNLTSSQDEKKMEEETESRNSTTPPSISVGTFSISSTELQFSNFGERFSTIIFPSFHYESDSTTSSEAFKNYRNLAIAVWGFNLSQIMLSITPFLLQKMKADRPPLLTRGIIPNQGDNNIDVPCFLNLQQNQIILKSEKEILKIGMENLISVHSNPILKQITIVFRTSSTEWKEKTLDFRSDKEMNIINRRLRHQPKFKTIQNL